MFGAELEVKGFERSQADLCVFRRVLRGKVVVIVVYVNDLLGAGVTKRDEEQALKDFKSCFPINHLRKPRTPFGVCLTYQPGFENKKTNTMLLRLRFLKPNQ